MDIQEHIITESDNLFCQYGIKSVTMADIASKLGISKKTIYQHFKDKNALVVEILRNKLSDQGCKMHENASQSANAVHELLSAVTLTRALLSKMNPTLFYDLQKYHPLAWKEFRIFREKALYEVIFENLKRGVQEGHYRPEINLPILTRMRIEQIDMIFNQVVYPVSEFNLSQVITEITEHFLYGICTPQGHELISKYKQII
ncbi:MAG TPA: TetR/AcrR family transcriptional regulator [Daejeonella sp.]|nr:TetR/AcrR family transcriptional regulator [Daejeonella sp.]